MAKKPRDLGEPTDDTDELVRLANERVIAQTKLDDDKRREAMDAQALARKENAEFDYNDPKNRAKLVQAAHDIGHENAAEKFRQAIAETTKTPEGRQELAAKVLGTGGGYDASLGTMVPPQSQIALGDMTGGAGLPTPGQPATTTGAAPAVTAPVVSDAPAAAGAPKADGAATPAAAPVEPGVPPSTELDASDPVAVYKVNSELTKSVERDKLAAEQLKQNADAITGAVEQERKTKQVTYANTLEQELKEIQAKYTQKADDQMTHFRAAVDDLAAVNPNPWASRDITWQIGSAFFIGLTQMGLGIAGSNAPNQAVQMFEHSLNRDLQQHNAIIEQKRGNIAQQGNLLERMQTIFNDKKTALQAAKVAGWERINAEAERQLATKGPELLGIQAKQTLALTQARLKEEKVKLIDQLHANLGKQAQMESHERIGMAAAGQKTSKALQDAMSDMTTYRGNTSIQNAAEALRNIDSARSIMARYPNLDDMPVKDYNAMISEMAKIASGGAATENMVKELSVSTLRSKFSELKGKLTSENEPAHLGKFIQKASDYLNELYQNNRTHVSDYERKMYRAHAGGLTEVQRRVLRESFPSLHEDDTTANVQVER